MDIRNGTSYESKNIFTIWFYYKQQQIKKTEQTEIYGCAWLIFKHGAIQGKEFAERVWPLVPIIDLL